VSGLTPGKQASEYLVNKYHAHKLNVCVYIVQMVNYAEAMTSKDVNRTPDRVLSLLLDDQMCFALYAASRAVTAFYRPVLEQLGLTYPQYLVLMALWEHDEVAVKDLGATLQLDYGTLTPLLKRLEVNGLVRRERRSDDERAVWISLTDEGAALRERARAIPPLVDDAMGLDPEEFVRIRAVIHRLTANVTARTLARR
jgi:DNA-binding MarR family transcriptional regulator